VDFSKVKTIVFDVDGVLLEGRNPDGSYKWQENVEEDLGIKSHWMGEDLFGNESEIVNLLKGKVEFEDLFEKFRKKHNLNLDIEVFLKYWLDNDFKVEEQILSIVRKLKNKGYRLFLGTNQPIVRGEYFWKQKIFNSLFEKIFIPYYVGGYSKPEKEFYDFIEKETGIEKQDFLFIDDVIKNVEAAVSNGWQGYHYVGYEKGYEDIFKELLK